MINAAILGLGWWGQALVRAVQGRSQRIRFVKAVVPDMDKRASAGAELNLVLTSSYEEVLADASIRAVVIATPHSMHVEQVMAAARAGKHVMCEKPLSLTGDGASNCVAACDEAGVVLAVGHNRRFMPAFAVMRRLLHNGELGSPLHIEAHSSNENARTHFSRWRSQRAESPAAGMTGTGVHLLDLLVSLLGRPSHVYAKITAAAVNPPEDTCNVLLTFANGVSTTLSMVQTTPRYWRMHLFGSAASIEIVNDHEVNLYRAGAPAARQTVDSADLLHLELEAFARAVDGEAEYPVSPDEMVWTAATLEAVCRSLESGKVERIAP